MHWDEIVARACACALCAVIIPCGCMSIDEQDSSGAATADGPPAGTMSGGQPPSGAPPGTMSGERPEMTMEMLEAQVAALEEQGIDVSAIREALDAGDREAAMEAFREVMMEHRDDLPEEFAGRPPVP